MKLKSLQLFRVPSLLLAAALQVLPVVRAALPAVETAGNIMAIIFRWGVGAAAAFGGVNAVSGASTLITNPLNVSGTNGVPFTLRLTTAPNQAHYWTASGLPGGLTLVGTNGTSSWKIAGTPTQTGTFNVGLTAKDQSTSGLDRTVSATLILNILGGVAPPTIDTQPVSLVRTQAQSATFSVGASGTGTLSYQWRFNNANLSGQTASSLTINPVSTNNAGNYAVVVSNNGGSVTSSVVSLTVIVPPTAPTITTQPANKSVIAGQSASFSVGASGTAPLSYQWRFGGSALASETNSVLNLNSISANNAGNYDVVIANSVGSVTSLVATLTVNVPPAITTQPAPQTITQGQMATFTVAASGTMPFTYYWKKGTSVVSVSANSGFSIANAQTSDAGSYSVIVSNIAGVATSSSVNLTVNAAPQPPFISASPTNKAVVLNSPASFSVTAGGTAPLSYQWFANGSPAGANSSTYTIGSVQNVDLGSYYVVVTNSYGSVTSSIASLTLIAPPVITADPVSVSNLVGATLQFSVTASSSVPVGYQWQKSGSNVLNGSGISGAQSSLLTFSNVQMSAAGNYSVIVTNIAGAVTSQVATLTLAVPPQILSTLTVLVNGSGSITPNYNGQQLIVGSNYTMTAVADSGSTFANWTGGISSSSATLNFMMQSNLVLTASFQAIPATPQFTNGTYNGLFYEAGGVSLFSSGQFTATTTANGRFSSKLMLFGKKYSFTGQFDSAGRATNTVARGTLAPLQVELVVSAADADQITGRVTDGSWSADLIADRAVFGAANPAPQAGYYTFILPGVSGDSSTPAGSSFGTVTIDSLGRVKMKGTLADGSKISQSIAISKNGEWPLFVSLYRGAGLLMGWVTVTNQGDLSGPINWLKGQQPADPRYPMGFSLAGDIEGSKYVAPTTGISALQFTGGITAFTGGNLSQSLTNQIVLNANNTITVVSGPQSKLTITPTTGLFKGSVVNPVTSKAIPFNGVLLQKQNHGSGFFLGATESGDVYLGQ